MTPKEILEPLSERRRQDALWLLSALLGVSKAEILLEARRDLSKEQSQLWKKWWKKRLLGEPMQYVAGSAPFYGRDFRVNRHVLIPRPETEMLVELALRNCPRPTSKVLDLCTGSGCVAISLKLERADLKVKATDISAKALDVARENSRLLGAQVEFENHDLFSPELGKEKWDLVVANPPYLAFNRDKVAADVKKWEPRMALEPRKSSAVRGMRDQAAWCAERILQASANYRPQMLALELSPRVAMALERRWRKSSAVDRIWREADLTGRKRFLLVTWKTDGKF